MVQPCSDQSAGGLIPGATPCKKLVSCFGWINKPVQPPGAGSPRFLRSISSMFGGASLFGISLIKARELAWQLCSPSGGVSSRLRPMGVRGHSTHDETFTAGAGKQDHAGLLLVMSGPSGVGKTTIVHELIRRFGGMFSVSATTRERTAHEVDGADYYFLDEATFQRWIDEDRFLEYAQVFGRSWYGTPEAPVREELARGKLVVLDIDVQGAENVRKRLPGSLGIFIMPPNEQELLQRLRTRGREDAAAIDRRFSESKREIARAQAGNSFDALVVNDTLQHAIEEVAAVVAARLACTK